MLDGVATNTVYITIQGPQLGEDGDVTLTGTQTLTNKTLTAPKIGTSILDTNVVMNYYLLTATGSAVNELTYSKCFNRQRTLHFISNRWRY